MEEILKAGAMGESVWVEKKGVDGETRPHAALNGQTPTEVFGPLFQSTSKI